MRVRVRIRGAERRGEARRGEVRRGEERRGEERRVRGESERREERGERRRHILFAKGPWSCSHIREMKWTNGK